MAEVLVQVGEFRPEHVQVLMDPAPEALLRSARVAVTGRTITDL